MIGALLAQFWPYILALVGAAAVALGLRQSGKSAARVEDAAKLNKQAEQAQKEHRDVQSTVAAMDDVAVDRELDEWVRGPKGGR